jgi:hypothetical protein
MAVNAREMHAAVCHPSSSSRSSSGAAGISEEELVYVHLDADVVHMVPSVLTKATQQLAAKLALPEGALHMSLLPGSVVLRVEIEEAGADEAAKATQLVSMWSS